MKDFFKRLKARCDFRNEHNVVHVTKLRKVTFWIPVAVVLLAIILGLVYQFVPSIDKFANIGIDFQGGTLLQVQMVGNQPMLGNNQQKNTDFIVDIAESYGVNVALTQTSGEDTIIVRYTNFVNGKNYGSDELVSEMSAINNQIEEDIKAKFLAEYGVEPEVSTSITGASASNSLIKTAFLSVGIALILIFIYIIIRFDLFSGISAVIVLLHDVLIMVALTIIFRVEINSPFVAAIITIVAYSINNTIMVFDRVRTNVADNKKSDQTMNPYELADRSLTDALVRTVFCTFTTAITILILIIIGVASIRSFGLPIFFGLLAGLFSSVFISPSLWAMMTDAKMKRDKKKGDYKQADGEKKENKIKQFFEKMKPTPKPYAKKKKKKNKKASSLT